MSTPTDAHLIPMLASVGDGIPRGPGWTFEPKYDGIRVIAHARPGAVSLVTRNGIDRAPQFPEIAAALRAMAARRRGGGAARRRRGDRGALARPACAVSGAAVADAGGGRYGDRPAQDGGPRRSHGVRPPRRRPGRS